MATTTTAAACVRITEMAPFLTNLRHILDTMDYFSIIRWSQEGYAIEIHDEVRLTTEILPVYYTCTKFCSFQRQLNYFHFRKWSRSYTAVCTFSNLLFQRDTPQLAWQIKRKMRKASAAKVAMQQRQQRQEQDQEQTQTKTRKQHLQHRPVATLQQENPPKPTEKPWSALYEPRRASPIMATVAAQTSIINSFTGHVSPMSQPLPYCLYPPPTASLSPTYQLPRLDGYDYTSLSWIDPAETSSQSLPPLSALSSINNHAAETSPTSPPAELFFMQM